MIAEEAWRCDICRKRMSADDTPAVDCNLECMSVEMFQSNSQAIIRKREGTQ